MSNTNSFNEYHQLSMVKALNRCLNDCLKNDPKTLIIGEDVGKNGGVFRVTEHLQSQHGMHRVIDSPLAESLLAGLAIGMSLYGLKPIVEFQFSGFIYPGFDQIINHAARMRNRTRGRLTCPIVYRAPFSGGIHAPEHHSESPEALFAHIPGLRVVIPSTPARAYGLLKSSVESPDPILFFEPKKIYHSFKQDIDPTQDFALDQIFVDREGSDVTVLGWGAMMPLIHEAANELAPEVSVEVLDVATIKPLDKVTILNSIRKTGRMVIVHEAPGFCGVGAEIAATIAEEGIMSLIAPIKRVTGFDVTMPYFAAEHLYLPNCKRIIDAIKQTMEFHYG